MVAMFCNQEPTLLKTVNQIIRKLRGKHHFPPDFTADEIEIIRAVLPYTKTNRYRIQSLIHAVNYLEANSVPGAIVECGVYKGGSMLAVAKALLQLGKTERELFLFDTYEGMGEPCEKDVSYKGLVAVEERKVRQEWSKCTLEAVQAVFCTVPYPQEKLHYVKGFVEDTVPEKAPDTIALLRLDTDWYESTKHELEHLYPRLVTGGVLIIDDYGHWAGARQATDEFFAKQSNTCFLHRIDYSARIAVKISP